MGNTRVFIDDLDFYTYNAKAHPNLSKPGEILISYNVNSFDFLDDIVKHPYHLRPRFISVKILTMKAINLIIISAMLLLLLPEKYFSQNKRCCISIECFQYGSDRIKRDNISLLGQRFTRYGNGWTVATAHIR